MEVKKYLIQNFIARACFLGSALLINIFFSRLLGAAGSGELYYTINNFSVIALIAGFSLDSGMTFFLSRKEIDDRELVTFSLLWALIAGCLASVSMMLLLNGNYYLQNSYNTPLYFFLFIAGTLATTYFSALFIARQQFLYPLLVPAITNIVVMLYSGWLFIVSHKITVAAMAKTYFIGFSANGIILAILYGAQYGKAFLFRIPSGHTLRRLSGYSAMAFVTNIIAFFAMRIDYWILKGFGPRIITDAALGNYIQVAKLVQLFLFAPTIAATVVFPVSAAGYDMSFKKKLKKIIWLVLLINMIGCSVLLMTGKWLFCFMFGKSFSAMYMCFVFSVPAILAITIVRVLASYFAGINRIRYNLVGGLIALTAITLLNFLLIPSMGINGAALADSAGYIGYMIFLLILINNKQNQQL